MSKCMVTHLRTPYCHIKGKVKCTLVEALRLCTGCTAHRRSRGIALLFLDHGTRRGWGVSVTAQPLFTPRKDLVPIVQEAGWAPGPVWTGAENLARSGFDPRTIQPVASHYSDWAITAHILSHELHKIPPAHYSSFRICIFPIEFVFSNQLSTICPYSIMQGTSFIFMQVTLCRFWCFADHAAQYYLSNNQLNAQILVL